MLLGRCVPSLQCVRHASTYYDAVIVGGGMVGNAMAVSLGKSRSLAGKKVLLLEGGNMTRMAENVPELYSNRVSAVSPMSIALFKKLGIWDRLEKYRVKKVSKLHVLDSCSHAQIEFDRPDPKDEIAFIVENEAIVGALYEQMTECEGLTVRTEATVKEYSLPSDLNNLASLKLADGDTIETSLVIGADGFKSSVRRAMGVDYTAWDYEQMGLVATLKVEADGDNSVAWQRFAKLGPIAILPLSKEYSSLVWTTSPEEALRLKKLPVDEFVDELNMALFTEKDQNPFVNQALFTLAKMVEIVAPGHKSQALPPHVISLQSDTRAAFPLGFGHAHTYICPRACVIGDAAHRVHPLAGQGVNIGWSDVILLMNTLNRATEQGADLGCVTYLREFDSSAQRHNVSVMVSIDWLNRLYRTDAPAVVAARSFGLAAVNAFTPIKDMMIHYLSKNTSR